jgi:hypothetical protein
MQKLICAGKINNRKCAFDITSSEKSVNRYTDNVKFEEMKRNTQLRFDCPIICLAMPCH